MLIVPALAALALGATLADPPTAVHRCIGDHGEIAYTGKPCAALGHAVATGATGRSGHGGYRIWTHTCAATADDLLDRVAAAFDLGDVNLLGGLFIWRGMGNRNAYRHMGNLAEMLERPLAGIDLGAPALWQHSVGGYRSRQSQTLTIWLGGTATGKPEMRSYELVRRDACVWLGF